MRTSPASHAQAKALAHYGAMAREAAQLSDGRQMESILDAFSPLANAATLAACTLWPWVIDLAYTIDGKATRTIRIVQSTMAASPAAEDILPANGELLRCDVFPATRFDDMAYGIRPRYRPHYQAFLMWRRAHAMGKTTDQLRPWDDFDPVYLEESVLRWSIDGARFAGD